jgi:serine protein kinase
MEFVEMFKAPIKMLHPLLTATQEGNYAGTENIGGIPYQGIILAHSNEAEWQAFRNNKNNEAFIDRISVIKVPYCLRATEERKIYEKLLQNSELSSSPCAPSTLDILSRFCVLSRLKAHENSNLYSKMRVYDGESLKDTDPRAKSAQNIRHRRGRRRHGRIRPRFAFWSVRQCSTSTQKSPPTRSTCGVLEQSIWRAVPEETEEIPQHQGRARYAEFIGHEIQKAIRTLFGYGQTCSIATSLMPMRGSRTRLGSRHRPADEPRL